ncbi:hypothetical protein BKA69DRAFT_1092241 [Paraphysoderma sedebokerense]|nr:hypothetical protein BKA69DRAFT_1092241 [Paraphysoderma sedebokerense]
MPALPNWDLDETFSYLTIKLVRIKDRRLGFLHYGFQLAILIFIIYQIVSEQLYLKKEPPNGGSVITTLRLGPTDLTTPLPTYCTASAVDGCLFWDGTQAFSPDLAGGFLTTRVSVTPMSYRNTASTNASCSTQLPESRDCLPRLTTNNTRRYYTADVENMTIMIEHSVKGMTTGVARSNKQMKGTLLASNGTTLMEWHPATDKDAEAKYIRQTPGDVITVQQLIEAAGLANLDEFIDPEATNKEAIRYSGMVIVVFIEYDNRLSDPSSLKYKYRINKILGSEAKREEFMYNSTIAGSAATGNAGALFFKKHGLQIRFVQTGTIGEFSIMSLLSNLAGALALLKVASTLVDLLMLYALPQKTLYTDAKYENTADFSDIRQNNVHPEPTSPKPRTEATIDKTGKAAS